jgi:ATP-binding cassette subfamily C protein
MAETGAGPAPAPGPGRAAPASGGLRIAELTFAYGLYVARVIDGLTLDIPAGQQLAVVGPSGIGKSTLAALITGQITAQAGMVLLGGVPIGQLGETSLRRAVALIPQEAYVFTGTLRENLGYLREVTDAELDQAVDAVGLRLLVDRLGGYGAHLGVGGPVLSAGERQLIALARVYVCPATVILLDEASCHLDPQRKPGPNRRSPRPAAPWWSSRTGSARHAGLSGSCCSTGRPRWWARTTNCSPPLAPTPAWWATGTTGHRPARGLPRRS